MIVEIKENDKCYEFKNAKRVQISENKLKINYVDAKGEAHEEYGDLPESICIGEMPNE